jgi:hypothetical protein
MNAFERLEAWHNGSKHRSVKIESHPSYGAMPGWCITLTDRNLLVEVNEAMICVRDDSDFPGLSAVIEEALKRAA